jgi:hypothetical protein
MAASINDGCFVCGVERLPHQLAEERGEINHGWSSDARVERSTLTAGRGAKSAQGRPTVMITVVPAPDLGLRRLLEAKGFITAAEIAQLDSAPVIKPEDLGI